MKNSKPAVLMINLTNIGQGEGGAIHQLALARRFVERGYRVRLLAPKRAEEDRVPPALKSIVRFTPSLMRWGVPGSMDGLLQIPYLLAARSRGFKTLYIRSNLFTFVLILVARFLRMRVISEHNCWSASERRGLGGRRLMIKFEAASQVLAAKLSHRVRSVTEGIADLIVQHGVQREKTVVIGNGSDVHSFQPCDRDEACEYLGIPSNVFRLGFIGGLVPWQGVATAIRCLQHLPETDEGNQAVELTIVGDGPERGKLEQLAKELGVSDHVRFIGYISRDKAPNVIGSFDVALAPFTKARNAEIGLSPIKIRDYAACGRPVVASSISGIRELEGYGWLQGHLPDDAIDLSKVLVPLIGSADARKEAGENARRFAEEYFEWDRVADSVIRSLIYPSSD